MANNFNANEARVAVPRGVTEPRRINAMGCLPGSKAPELNQSDSSGVSNRTAPTFWFAERGFENSLTPCICMDNPTGGDPIIIAQIVPNEFWRNYVNAMCDAATVTFRMADELSGYLAALNKIAKGTAPLDQNGHYLAHREAVKVAREVLRKGVA